MHTMTNDLREEIDLIDARLDVLESDPFDELKRVYVCISTRDIVSLYEDERRWEPYQSMDPAVTALVLHVLDRAAALLMTIPDGIYGVAERRIARIKGHLNTVET